MLTLEKTVLFIVDVQGKLAQLMHDKETLFDNLQKIVKGARILDVPVLWAEQNPKGLGPTIPEIAGLLPDMRPFPKLSFSCCGDDGFMRAFRSLNRSQVLIAGIETHVCVYQTAADLLSAGHEVQIVADAVSSRHPNNKRIGLKKIRDDGGSLTSAETALFELLRVAEGDKFKQILKLVR